MEARRDRARGSYGIAASTVSNWEQGRRSPDPAAPLLLKTIEADPDFVERVAKGA